MSFGQAFATAFLNGLTGQILESRKTAKEERLRKERIAETAGLQQYLKRQANFNKYKNIATSLINTYNADKDSVVRLATNPLLLAEADAYIKNFSKKFPNTKITKKRIDGFLSSLDLVMPEEGMTLEQAARKASGLALMNTDIDAEKKDSSIMENNFFLSALGFGSEEREDQKLRDKAVGQGFSMFDLYTMGVGGDYTSPDQATGRLDYSYFPDPITVSEEKLLSDNVKRNSYNLLTKEIQDIEKIPERNRSDLQNQTFARITTLRNNYDAEDARAIEQVENEFGGEYIAEQMLRDKSIERYFNVGSVTPEMLQGALQYLYNNKAGIDMFTEDEILNKAESIGLKITKVNQPNQAGASQQVSNQNVSTNQQPPAGQVPVPTQAHIDGLMANPSEIDAFVQKFTVQGLPAKIDKKRPTIAGGGGLVNIREWDRTWGKYYNADGTKK